ncbi:MAG: site-specific integrase [Lachnospiraceae bacterium]|nr:site-specific integrase [Lachnospiraceae bacterium]
MSTKRFTNLMQGKDNLLAGNTMQEYTVEEWYLCWIRNFKEPTVKRGTLDSYNCMFRFYIGPFLGNIKLKHLNSTEIQSFYNELAKNDYSKSTITLIHALLTNLLRYAYRMGLMEKNPMEMVILPRARKKQERRVLSREEQQLLLSYIKGTEIEMIVTVALATGMRIGELSGLTWDNIDFSKNEIHVLEILKKQRGGDFYKDTPKTGKSRRTIPLLPQISSKLRKYQQLQEYWRKAGHLPQERRDLGHLVFLRENGAPFSDLFLCRQLKKAAERIEQDGIPFAPITPHCLRHTFATRALENGISAKVVQELLGHSTITLTLDLYTHVMQDTKTEEIQKIADLF